MRHVLCGIILSAALVLVACPAAAVDPPSGPLKKCPVDAVVSGTVCMDKYEASVWRVPRVPVPTGVVDKSQALVAKIQEGTASVAELTRGGATQVGVSFHDGTPCGNSGQNCANIYAVSLPGVLPSANITWFQAQQACKNARKRLPSNAEWQAAVAGTPDPGPDNGTTDCNTDSGTTVATGSRSSCVSSDGAFDMVGNLSEWVADWVPRSPACTGSWGPGTSPTGDVQCLAGAATTGEPGALIRGGGWGYGTDAGPLAVRADLDLTSSGVGFRCAR